LGNDIEAIIKKTLEVAGAIALRIYNYVRVSGNTASS